VGFVKVVISAFHWS